MFNLEQSIAQWRAQMRKEGIKRAALLDELESHLRDEIDFQMRSGLALEQAFLQAIEHIGRSDAISAEFRKVSPSKGNIMNHNRLYTATLWTFAIYNLVIIACTFFFWKMIGGQWNEPLGRFPAWSLPWLFALTCVYIVLIAVTLYARRTNPETGRKLSMLLNCLLLAAIPGGTIIGLYGLFFVDKQKTVTA
jgi:hypothetical protein